VDVVAGVHPDHPALLIRPDGFVAWAGITADGLVDALTRWFGSPTGSSPGPALPPTGRPSP
jgi:hypothetical protein